MPRPLIACSLPAWWPVPLLLFPWLSPYTVGPTPNVWPLLLAALCAVILGLFRHRLSARLVTVGWLVAAAVSTLIGLLQYFGLSAALEPWISQTQQPGEAFANLRQRNQFATLTSIGLLALIGLLAVREKPGGQPLQSPDWCPPLWACLLALLLALGNAASSSRTGLLQWVLIAALTTGWALPAGRRSLALLAWLALGAYAIAVFMLPGLLQWVTGLQSGGLFGRLGEAPGCSSRMVLWSNVLTLIAHKPWLGWGWGELDYAHFITLYPGPRFCEILDNAHNLPLHLAVELGIPAAVVIFGGLGWLAWRGRPWREKDPVRQMAWGVLAVIALHSLLEYPLWYGPFQIAAGLAVWLLFVSRPASLARLAIRQGFSAGVRQNSRLALYLRALPALALIGALAAVAISYHRVSQIYLPLDKRSAAYRDDTLAKVRGNWLFGEQARFAELSITPLAPGNAALIYPMAVQLLHYSPEPRVIEKVIESAVILGQDGQALHYLVRYRAAFPKEHAEWAEKNAAPPRLVP